jgi:hypothetical protein
VHRDCSVAEVQALAAKDHCDCCSLDAVQDFAVRRGLDMQAIAVAREQASEVRDGQAVMMGLSSQGKFQMEAQQAVSTAAA